MSFDWKNLVRTVAPTIGTVLGSPMAGVAISALSEALLGRDNGTIQEVSKAVAKATPQDLAAIKQADVKLQQVMAELEIDVFSLEVEDRKSARDLFKINQWPQIILSGAFLTAYFVILGTVLLGDINIEAGFKDVVILLLGLMVREVPTVMGFWFGTSLGSKEKSAQLAVKSKEERQAVHKPPMPEPTGLF